MRVPQNNKTFAGRIFAVLVCTALVAGVSVGQLRFGTAKSAEEHFEGPFAFGSTATNSYHPNGNPDCVLLNSLDNPPSTDDPNFAHIENPTEFKIDSAPTNNLPYAIGGTDSFITFSGVTTTSFSSWSISPEPVDRQVAALIVKSGNVANVYTYPLGAYEDSGNFTGPVATPPGDIPGISHISICFEPTGAPTSAPATIAGRVITTNGRGVIGTTMILTNAMTGEIYSTTTNQLGYYLFEGIPSAEFYILSASQRGVTFFENQKTFTLEEDLVGLDFVAASSAKK